MKLHNTTAALIFCLAGGASAGEGFATSDVVQVSLLSGWESADGARIGAIRVSLAPGWKTYWRVAGETGLPPSIDWEDSSNLASVQYFWPRPELISSKGTTILGYQDELILPVRFEPLNVGEEMRLSAALEIGVCNEICVPVSARLQSESGDGPDDENFLIELAMDSVPEAAESLGIPPANCHLSGSDDEYRLQTEIELPSGTGKTEYVVVESPDSDLWFMNTDSSQNGRRLVTNTAIVSLSGDGKPDLSSLTITLLANSWAVEITGCSSG